MQVNPLEPRVSRRYVRAPEPIVFPVEGFMPETKRHLEVRTALYEILKIRFSREAWIGSEQFVYWDPTDPSANCAPDAFVRLGGPDALFDSWKVWERGAPQLGVEIVSDDDASPSATKQKLRRYHRMGVLEFVRFDPQEPSLRIWDRVDGDLVERVIETGVAAECGPLRLFWQVVPSGESEWMLRLSADAAGQELLPTHEELLRAAERQRGEAERQRGEAERQRGEAERQRLDAEARVRELEAELARRS